MKVMPGTGSNSTAEALRLTQFAEKVGADAALQVAPYYNKPTQQGFYEHFKCLAEETNLPQCVYNIPGRTAKNIEPDTICRLAELENITMVKEATGSLDQASQILSSTKLTVLSGDDSMTLPLLSVGGKGVISVVGNIVPNDMIALVSAFEAGNLSEAQALHHKLFPLCRDMVGALYESDTHQGGHEDVGPRHGRAASADDFPGCDRGSQPAADSCGLRTAVSGTIAW